MSETHPLGGVEPVSDIERVQNFLNQPQGPEDGDEAPENEPQQATEAQSSEQPQSPADELTADDLPPDDVPQPEVDAFEIVHNGAQVKLTREQVIEHARQGFDYTHKTQQLAEQRRALDARLARLAEAEKVQPQLQQAHGLVAAFAAQLQQYQNVDWVKVATDDPVGYAPARAKYDVLVNSYNQALHNYQQQQHAVHSHLSQIQQEQMREEAQKLPELIPEWKDQAKREAGLQQVVKYIRDLGGDPAVVKDALSVSVVRKAMLYDQLLKSKGEKVKQLRTAPPVTRPGAALGQDAARADKTKQAAQKLRKTGDVQDAAAYLLQSGFVK